MDNDEKGKRKVARIQERSPSMAWTGLIGFVPTSDKALSTCGEPVFYDFLVENMIFSGYED